MSLFLVIVSQVKPHKHQMRLLEIINIMTKYYYNINIVTQKSHVIICDNGSIIIINNNINHYHNLI